MGSRFVKHTVHVEKEIDAVIYTCARCGKESKPIEVGVPFVTDPPWIVYAVLNEREYKYKYLCPKCVQHYQQRAIVVHDYYGA